MLTYGQAGTNRYPDGCEEKRDIGKILKNNKNNENAE